MDLTDASIIFQRAEELIGAEEYEVETVHVLRLCAEIGCSACDCEYYRARGIPGCEARNEGRQTRTGVSETYSAAI